MRNKPRLLVVSPTFPWPLVSGGKQRVFYVLRELSKQFDLALLSLAEPGDDTPAARTALGFLSELQTVPIRQNRLSQLIRLGLRTPAWLLGAPAEVLVKRTPAFDATFNAMLGAGSFDAVLIEYSQLLHLVPIAQRAGLPVAVTAHDVSFVSQQRKADVSSGFWKWFWSREARLMRRHEVRGWKKSDLIFSMSEHDREQILTVLPSASVTSMPNGVDTQKLQPMAAEKTPTLVFVGWMRHFPNLDAVRWLLRDIWPLIKVRHDTVVLKLCGGGMPEELRQLAEADPSIEHMGFVDDIASEVGRATLSIVPIRIGSGSRLKVLESMALGTPIVSTHIGSEGIAVEHQRHLWLADEPQQIADAVLALLDQPELIAGLALRGRQLVEEQYDWQAIGGKGAQALQEMMERHLDA